MKMIILFYSEQCQHSKNIIIQIQKSSLQNDIKMFCIDGFQPLPQYLTHVPTIKIEPNTLLVGNDILEWLETHKKPEEIQDQVASSTGSYTMLGEHEEVNEIDAVYNSRINTPQGQMPSKDGKSKMSSSSVFPQNEKMQSSAGIDMAYEQLVAERSYGGTNGISRI